ncbi:hypothetical protein GCM10027398_03320 [Azotobacter salinestris]
MAGQDQPEQGEQQQRDDHQQGIDQQQQEDAKGGEQRAHGESFSAERGIISAKQGEPQRPARSSAEGQWRKAVF